MVIHVVAGVYILALGEDCLRFALMIHSSRYTPAVLFW